MFAGDLELAEGVNTGFMFIVELAFSCAFLKSARSPSVTPGMNK